MSVANPSRTNAFRDLSYTVRLTPYFVETVCELTRAMRDKVYSQTEVSGLLFGRVVAGCTEVDALKTFKDSGPRSDLARRERLDKAYASAVVEARGDSQLAALRLVGWFSLRSSSGLLTSDINFHNRHFKTPEDLALVIWREADTQAIAELYSKAEGDRLSSDDYRWSSVRLSTEMRRVSEPIDLAMRARVSEDSYLRTYQSTDSAKPDNWKKIVDSVKLAVLGLFPARRKAESQEEGHGSQVSMSRQPARSEQSWNADTLFRGAEETVGEPVRETVREPSRIVEPEHTSAAPSAGRGREVSGLPMVIKTKAKQASLIPWVAIGLVFLLFSGVTFAIFAVKGLGSGNGKIAQIARVLFPGTDLGVHVDSQGDKLLLSWNRRNPVVASANDAVLQIFDGPEHREVKLDSGQVADGSVLYKPVSKDVTFRLEVHGSDQSTVFGSLRVLDATSSAVNAGASHTLDLTKNPAPATASRAGKAAADSANKAAANARRPVIYRNGESGRVSVPVPLPATTPTTPGPAANAEQSANSGQAPNTGQDVPLSPTPNSAAANSAATQTPRTAQPAAAGSVINGWDPGAPEARPAAAPEREGPAANSGGPDAGTDTGTFVAPKPLLQVMPNTKTLPPGAVPQVTRVEVQVRIDNSGHVVTARALNEGSVNGALSSAAVAAARQWTFEPAMQRGEKVPSDHTIVFEFRPETPEQQ